MGLVTVLPFDPNCECILQLSNLNVIIIHTTKSSFWRTPVKKIHILQVIKASCILKFERSRRYCLEEIKLCFSTTICLIFSQGFFKAAWNKSLSTGKQVQESPVILKLITSGYQFRKIQFEGWTEFLIILTIFAAEGNKELCFPAEKALRTHTPLQHCSCSQFFANESWSADRSYELPHLKDTLLLYCSALCWSHTHTARTQTGVKMKDLQLSAKIVFLFYFFLVKL